MTKTLKQKLKDKRFRENEMKILRLIFVYGDTITMERVAKLIGVERSTIYRHHKTLKEMTEYYVEKVVNECEKCNEDVRKFYTDLLIYIIKDKEVFLVFYRMRDWRALLAILEMNEDGLMEYAGYRQRMAKAFNIYKYEILAVMDAWGEKSFSKDDFDVVLNDILFLTKNMKVRLGPLCGN